MKDQFFRFLVGAAHCYDDFATTPNGQTDIQVNTLRNAFRNTNLENEK